MKQSKQKSGRPNIFLVRWLLLGGILLLLIGVGQKSWRIYRLARQIEAHTMKAQEFREQGLSTVPPAEFISLAADLRKDTAALQLEIEPYLPLAPYLSWLPRVGPLMPHAADLMGAANEATYLADLLAPGFAPAAAVVGEGPLAAQLPQLLALLEQQEALLAQAQPVFLQLMARYDRITDDPDAVAALPAAAEQLVTDIEPLLPLAPHMLPLATVLPEIAGHDSPKTYLIIAQNRDELRATGGFISGVGLITVADGQPGEIAFQDAYQIDDFTKPYGIPPQPLEQFMGVQLLVFRDANYWPDFPTSAAKMMELYTYGTGQQVDGVVAIDQTFLAGLVKILKTVSVDGFAEPITGQNVDQFLRDAWETGDPTDENWFASRKSFLGPVSAAIVGQLMQNPDAFDPLELAAFMNEAMAGGHLQFLTTDPAINPPLRAVGLTGEVTSFASEDLLMVVSSNMGFNKANAAVDQEVEYSVVLAPDGRGEAQLSVNFTHHAPANDEPCRQKIYGYGSGENLYERLINDCYWNYLRALTPPATTLIGGSAHPQPEGSLITGAGWSGEAVADPAETPGVVTISNLVAVPPGQSTGAHFSYQLPQVVKQNGSQNHYTLNIIKQPGIPPYPAHVTVTLPADAALINVNLPYQKLNDNQLSFNLDVKHDYRLQIFYSN